MERLNFNITIIGAGVVGLAIAEALASRYPGVLLIERNTGPGEETSSRNSEVIHAGLYYPDDSLKASLCLEGRRMLYDRCDRRGIPFRRIGKIVVSTEESEEAVLQELSRKGERNGVDDLLMLSGRVVRSLEPDVLATAGMLSPSTGIIDSHRLMQSFLAGAWEGGARVAFRSGVTAIDRNGSGYELDINDGEYRVRSRIVVNSAGLQSDHIAAMAGIDIDREAYRLKLCKGSYFYASPAPKLRHLVYPVPTPRHEGLGVHATLDLGGRVRFGPDVEYVTGIGYSVDESKGDAFHAAIQRYLPFLGRECLHPDLSGIRPKLQGPGEEVRDFVIREESRLGLAGWVNLIGIESPGLTASPAIANRVAELVKQII